MCASSNSGFILSYKFDEKKYIQIINFDQHQNPHVKECASTIQAPDLSDIKTPDSLSLDSLNLDPQTDTVQEPLSGKPDVPPEILKNKKCKEAAITVLEFLNEKTGKNYQPVLANLNLIISRLKEGSTEKDCFAIIENKIKEWSTDSKMMTYTRPKTLFNKINFWNYHGELVKQSKPREKKYCSCGRETLGQKYNQCAECLSLNSFDGLQAR